MNMGVTYRDSGKNSEALELLTKSLAIKEKILGEDEEVALGHFQLAFFYYRNTQEYGKAEGHFLEEARIVEKVHGPAHSGLGISFDWLIGLYQVTGEVEKEEEQQKKKEQWEKLQENKSKEEDNEEKKKEEKQNEMTLEELIKFFTLSDSNEPQEYCG